MFHFCLEINSVAAKVCWSCRENPKKYGTRYSVQSIDLDDSLYVCGSEFQRFLYTSSTICVFRKSLFPILTFQIVSDRNPSQISLVSLNDTFAI